MSLKLTRRRFMLLSAVAIVGAACAPSEPDKGLRGTGTTLRPRQTDVPGASAPETPEVKPPTPTLAATVTSTPAPHTEPIIAPGSLPEPQYAGPDAEAHVVPVVTGKPPVLSALPAKRIVIPTIGVDSKVIPLGTRLDRFGNIAWETAPFAVGQHKGLAGPGQNGNMVLSGHISSPNEGAIFHHLPDLKVGEGIIVATDERQYLYRVIDVKTVTPDQVQVMDPTPDPTATLLTCVPDGIYSHRLVVTARLV